MASSKLSAFLARTVEISKHHLKGVWTCNLDKEQDNSKGKVKSKTEVICTLSELPPEDWPRNPQFDHRPIGLTYEDETITLQPWDPYRCVLSAAINNRLLHFPIRPGSHLLMVDSSLRTLSHLANIVGRSGRILAVVQAGAEDGPGPEEVSQFRKRHRNVEVASVDIQNASHDGYVQLFSLPEKSKMAFCMSFHGRLGEFSPARILMNAKEHQKVVKHIFSYLTTDINTIDCLVCNHWPPNTSIDTIRQVVLKHLDILGQWRKPGDSSAEASAQSNESREKWVIMEMPADNIASSLEKPFKGIDDKFHKVVQELKNLPNGLKTGISPKEQLLLEPFWPRRAVLMLKYKGAKDQRLRGNSGAMGRSISPQHPVQKGTASFPRGHVKEEVAEIGNGHVKFRPPPGLEEAPAQDLSFFSSSLGDPAPPTKAVGSSHAPGHVPPHQQVPHPRPPGPHGPPGKGQHQGYDQGMAMQQGFGPGQSDHFGGKGGMHPGAVWGTGPQGPQGGVPPGGGHHQAWMGAQGPGGPYPWNPAGVGIPPAPGQTAPPMLQHMNF